VPEKYRIIKAKRIRGVFSMGMLVPCPPVEKAERTPKGFPAWVPGDSIVDVLALKKWEEDEEDTLSRLPKTKSGNMESPPKGFTVPKYDIEGMRKYVDALLPDEEIVLTEKVHGSNAAFVHDGTRLWVKSRNWFKKRDEDDMWWDIAIRYDLENKLAQFPHHVFYGEVYGQVKNFRYDTKIDGGRLLPNVRFFDIWNTEKLRYLDYDDFVAMIQAAGLEAMPILYRGKWQGKELMYPYAEGLTTLGGKHIREGFVLRTVKERYEPRLDSRMQVKLVSEQYQLSK
jgi:RNA ligase (TIGR02306 family)